MHDEGVLLYHRRRYQLASLHQLWCDQFSYYHCCFCGPGSDRWSVFLRPVHISSHLTLPQSLPDGLWYYGSFDYSTQQSYHHSGLQWHGEGSCCFSNDAGCCITPRCKRNTTNTTLICSCVHLRTLFSVNLHAFHLYVLRLVATSFRDSIIKLLSTKSKLVLVLCSFARPRVTGVLSFERKP